LWFSAIIFAQGLLNGPFSAIRAAYLTVITCGNYRVIIAAGSAKDGT
jgi:hypothetical protein